MSVNLPLAPNAASVAKYGDVPVSEFTGLPSISIPVTTLKHRGLGIDISLSYHAGGIRVSEEASWVGLGWSLNGGGVISRAVRGFDDFGSGIPTPGVNGNVIGYINAIDQNLVPHAPAPSGWFGGTDGIRYQTGYTFNDFIGPSGVNTFFRYCNDSQNDDNIDMESDLYSFSFNGYSGKFFINKQGEPQLYKAADLKIEYVYVNGGIRWEIKTPDGYRYIFGDTNTTRQRSYSYSSASTGQNDWRVNTYIGSWFIDRIITPQNEEITYAYSKVDRGVFPMPNYSERQVERLSGIGGNLANYQYNNPFQKVFVGCENSLLTFSIQGQQYDEVTLTSITAPYERVDFDSDYSRTDLQGGRKLFAVRHFSGGTLLTKTALSHSIAESTVTGGFNFHQKLSFHDGVHKVLFPQGGGGGVTYEFHENFTHGRLVLNSVQTFGSDESANLPPYVINYDNIEALPPKSSMAIDAYGFYNGILSNNKLIPETKLPVAAIGGYDVLEGGDRLVVEEFAKSTIAAKPLTRL